MHEPVQFVIHSTLAPSKLPVIQRVFIVSNYTLLATFINIL